MVQWRLNTSSDHSYAIYMRKKDVIIPCLNTLFGSELVNIQPPSSQYNYRGVTFKVAKTVTISRSTEERPCYESDSNQTLSLCIEAFLDRTLGCSLPWHKNKTRRICSGSDDFEAFQKISDVLEDVKESELLTMTGCQPPCVREDFTLKEAYQTQALDKTEHEAKKGAQVYFYFSSGAYLVNREVAMYSMSNLVADIGGYLGLLLGVSCFSVFDTLEKLIKKNQLFDSKA